LVQSLITRFDEHRRRSEGGQVWQFEGLPPSGRGCWGVLWYFV